MKKDSSFNKGLRIYGGGVQYHPPFDTLKIGFLLMI